jgi:hypothetical protein
MACKNAYDIVNGLTGYRYPAAKIGFPVARFRFPVGGSGKHSALHFHVSLGAPRTQKGPAQKPGFWEK